MIVSNRLITKPKREPRYSYMRLTLFIVYMSQESRLLNLQPLPDVPQVLYIDTGIETTGLD